MPVVNPGIRRFLGSAIQRLLNGAAFALPLTHTAIPERGDITPSFTRATTATGQKWDEAGYLDFTALAGEVVFKGARREYNQWTTSSVSLASGANKSLTLAAGTYQFSMGAGTGTATFSGTGGATGTLGASASGRVSVAKTITAGTFVVTASVADLADLQVCDLTGETDQTTIRPYVSVGVESSPAYHGSMVDGVKCYDTDRSGNPISTSGSYPLVGYVPWEARTNLCLQSQSFDTTWTATALTTISSTRTAPDGTATAFEFDDGVSGGTSHRRFQSPVNTTAVPHTMSVYAKDVDRGWIGFRLTDSGGVNRLCWFNIAAGVVGTAAAGFTTSIQSLPNGWYRCIATLTTFAGDSTPLLFLAPSDGVDVYVGSNKKAQLWGAQVELGSFATPYIPTTTVAVARNADVEAVTTSGAILAVGGTISLTYIPYHSPVGTIALWGTYVDASNYTAILHDATNLIFRKRIAGSNYDATIANAFVSGTTYKVAATWGAAGTAIYLDGVAGTPHANTTAAQIAATMQFGADGNSLQQPGAAVIKNYIWQRQLSASEMQAITA
jgi:hypothetical protein